MANYLNMPLHKLMALWDKKKFPHQDLASIKEAVMLRDKEESFYPSIQYQKSVKLSTQLFGHKDSLYGSRNLQPYHFITIGLELDMFDTAFMYEGVYYIILSSKPKILGGNKYSDCMILEYNLKGNGDFILYRALKCQGNYLFLHKLIRLSSQRNAKLLYRKLCLYKSVFEKESYFDFLYDAHYTYLGRTNMVELAKKWLAQPYHIEGVQAIANLEEKKLTLLEWFVLMVKITKTTETMKKADFLGAKNMALIDFVKKIKKFKK